VPAAATTAGAVPAAATTAGAVPAATTTAGALLFKYRNDDKSKFN
jgi:hypothetical protein